MIRTLRLICVSALLVLAAQTDDFSFYPSYRNWAQQTFPPPRTATADDIREKYRAKLAAEGVPAAEIDRRLSLLRTRAQDLENYFWNAALTQPSPGFNTEPNAFLVEMVHGRKPGTALDMGAGEGRNAVYLAKQGWRVTAVDPASEALALGAKRAEAAGAPIKTVATTDTEFDFGRNQWDLILYSWTNPKNTVARVVESLAPGGILVVEGAGNWWPENGLLKMFPTLHVVHYEDVRAKSDFFARHEMQVVRFCAEKKK